MSDGAHLYIDGSHIYNYDGPHLYVMDFIYIMMGLKMASFIYDGPHLYMMDPFIMMGIIKESDSSLYVGMMWMATYRLIQK